MNISESLLTFPSEFIIKIFGKASDQFEIEALTIIRNYVSYLPENSLRSRLSKDSKYLALTITIMAENREQLDEIYRDLSANPHVLMVL